MNCRILGLLCCLAACVPAQTNTQSPERNSLGVVEAYRLGPGDVLELEVFEVEELSRSVTVGATGAVLLPLLGEVRVGGMTTAEAADRLEQLYGESLLRDPQISVTVKEFRSQPVAIFGAVERPGVYQLEGRRRLLEVLAMAGGLSGEAGAEILITHRDNRLGAAAGRPCFDAEPGCFVDDGLVSNSPVTEAGTASVTQVSVSIRALLHDGRGDSNPWIEPRDEIRVLPTGLVYVLGAVGRPGGYPIEREPVTVLRAISLAEGLDRRASPRKARIIRRDGAAKQEIAVRVDDILRGKREDTELRDNDILFIPDSRAKGALSRGAEAAIQVATGVIIWRR